MLFSLTHLQESRDLQPQNQIFSLDGLFCEEERFEDDLGGWSCFENEVYPKINVKKPLSFFESDLFWEDDELLTLLSKEKQTHFGSGILDLDGSLMVARKEALDWMFKVIGHYGFNALTAVLAVNYFDRLISGVSFQKDKPWMSQLAAVACLSIAAKVEEIEVPLLLDFQVADSKYMFEAKTIQRMELLVLSTLQWRMNPVTPISFLDHIIRRFGLKGNLHYEFLRSCEHIILSVIADSRLLHYLPSVIATATMLIAIKEIESCNAAEYENELVALLNVSKEEVDECYNLILEVTGHHGKQRFQSLKRKYESAPGSPNGVIDAYFSCESSNDSWALAPSVGSSPELLYKRSRSRDQQMRLAPLGSVRGCG
ncbi:PREDICTED: cyclin-D3-3-like [Ipomoea nil]|uniref:cyclin-D3-3-like n=1 Tax=Ipomoea nil TaxID=35883 RepID=UPI0009008A27|nr:PREDICTED: cyclin-D3-3-like [Ipomoea nil]